MRLGIFGGTFDPIHIGHLILAEQCREACRLDRVLFVPAGQPPHKADRSISPPKQRLDMIELATTGHAAFGASQIELERSGPSYTVETLVTIQEQHPGAELFLLIGSDSLRDLAYWYQPDRIASLATIVVATRPRVEQPDLAALRDAIGDEAVARMSEHRVEIPLIEVSSSAVRARVAAGRSIRFLVPRAVECYIETHGLYRPAKSSE